MKTPSCQVNVRWCSREIVLLAIVYLNYYAWGAHSRVAKCGDSEMTVVIMKLSQKVRIT